MLRGFSTLVVVIVLGIAAVTVSFWLSSSSVFSIRDGINEKQSFITQALVSACAEVALETMRETTNYTGTSSLTLDGNVCSYTVVNTGGNNRTVTVSGSVGTIVRKLRIMTTAFNPLVIASWQDIP